MPDFSHRSDEIELMDDLSCSGVVIEQTLKELEVINKWLGGNHVTIDGIAKLVKNTNKEITIADLGCGGGDILKLVAKWARKKAFKVKLIGIDANASIVDFARRNCLGFEEIDFQVVDIFSDEFKTSRFDIITSTLFTHHFDNSALTNFYKGWLQQSNIGIVVNDLHRHWFAYYSIKWLTGLFSKSEMVKNDAAVSVQRSFIKKDIKSILSAAGITTYQLNWMWAFRWQLVIAKK